MTDHDLLSYADSHFQRADYPTLPPDFFEVRGKDWAAVWVTDGGELVWSGWYGNEPQDEAFEKAIRYEVQSQRPEGEASYVCRSMDDLSGEFFKGHLPAVEDGRLADRVLAKAWRNFHRQEAMFNVWKVIKSGSKKFLRSWDIYWPMNGVESEVVELDSYRTAV